VGGALTRQRHRRPADHLYRLLGLVNILAQLLWLMAPGKLRLVGLPLLTAFTLFIAWSLERLIQCLAKERRVGGRVVAGALAGYLLLGISGGLVLSVIDTIQPGSFISSMSHHVLSLPSEMAEGAAAAPVTRAWDLNFLSLNYFAFVSLTTVGYGDIVPMRPAAQIVSIALSVAGPFYIAVVMGVLISRLTIQGTAQARADPLKPDKLGQPLPTRMQGRAAIQGSWPAPRERARRPGPPSPAVVGIGIGGLKRPHRAEGKAGEPPRKRQ
jgi:hypothetical protein